MVTSEILEKAKWCSVLEMYYLDTDPTKLPEISLAYLEIIDKIIECEVSDDDYHQYLEPLLDNTIKYLETE